MVFPFIPVSMKMVLFTSTCESGNIHDSQERDALLLGDELHSTQMRRIPRKRHEISWSSWGLMIKCNAKATGGNPLSEADRVRNQEIAVIRSGGERPFATYKRHYGLARTRFMGLAKNTTVFGLAAMAANIRKGAKYFNAVWFYPPLHRIGAPKK